MNCEIGVSRSGTVSGMVGEELNLRLVKGEGGRQIDEGLNEAGVEKQAVNCERLNQQAY